MKEFEETANKVDETKLTKEELTELVKKAEDTFKSAKDAFEKI